MKARRIVLSAALLVAAVSVLCSTNPAAAAVYTWDGLLYGAPSDGSGNWDYATTNWYNGSPSVAWQDGNDAVFGAGTPGTYTVTLEQNVQPAGITFNTQGYTIAQDNSNPCSLTVGSDGITANASATINAPITLSAVQTWATAANQTLTISGVISGSGGLTKQGAGTLLLTNSQAYGGPTIIQGGTLKLQGAALAAVSTVAFTSDANSGISTSNTYTEALAFGQGSLTINSVPFAGAGTSGNGSFGSSWNLNLGSVPDVGGGPRYAWGAAFPGDFQPASGQTNAMFTYMNFNNGVAAPESLTVTGLTPGVAYDARVCYSVWESGGSRTGNFTFNGGNGTQNITVNEDANHTGNYIDYQYAAGSNGTLTISEVDGTASWLWYGFTNQVIPAMNNPLPLTTAVTIAANSTLDLGGANQQVVSLADYAPGLGGSIINSNTGVPSVLTLSPTGGSTTFSGTILGGGTIGTIGLVMNGTGTQVLAGSNTYSGGTTVNGGTLQAGSATAFGAGVLGADAGGTVDLHGWNLTVGGLGGNGGTISDYSAGGGTTTLTAKMPAGTTATSAAIIANGPNKTLAVAFSGLGTQILSGTSTYSGGTTISSGTLQLGDGISANGVINGNVVNNATLVFANPNAQGFSGAISGSGAVAKSAAGILTLAAGNSSYSGPTSISGGVLQAGAANVFSPNSAVTVASGATLDLNANSEVIGSLSGTGNVTLGNQAATVLSVGNDNSNTSFSGNISGSGGLTKQGAGTLLLTNSQAYGGPTVIQGGTLKLQGPALAAVSTVAFTSDANSGISTSNTYTEALAFGQGSLTINNVPFAGAAGYSGSNWTLSLPSPGSNGDHGWSGGFPTGFQPASGQTTNTLLYHFNWNGSNTPGPEALTVTGLTPGVAYDARVYYSVWASGESRIGNFTFNGGNGTQNITVNEDANNTGNYIDYRYAAGANGTLTISENDASLSPFNTWFWYGFTNQVMATNNPLAVTTAVTIAANSTLDLGGANQQVVSLADYAPGLGGSVINSTVLTSVLTLSPTGGSTTFSGTILGGGTNGTIGLVMNGTGTQVLAGTVAGSGVSLAVDNGTLVLSGSDNTYGGGTDVEGGTLYVTNSDAIPYGTGLTVGAGGVVTFGPSPVVAGLAAGSTFAASPAATVVAAVPEPGTVALLLAALWSAVIHRRFRRRSKGI